MRAIGALGLWLLAVAAPAAGQDAPLTADQRRFFDGSRLFNQDFAADDGLGPGATLPSCLTCHQFGGRPRYEGEAVPSTLTLITAAPARGGRSPFDPPAGRLGLPGSGSWGRLIATYEEVEGTFADGTPYSLRRPTYLASRVGPFVVSGRIAPPVLGAGLLERAAPAAVEALADPDDADGDGLSGRIRWVEDTAGTRRQGRFGWKAERATVAHQVADALWNDMGLTSGDLGDDDPVPDPEISPAALGALSAYVATRRMTLSDRPLTAVEEAGRALFDQAGCAACHVPRVALDDGGEIAAYTDLLLHDMGEGLADAAGEFAAEWRTAPLWGIGLWLDAEGRGALLHDGRARTLAEAILWHDGEAESAREAFRMLPEGDRDALLAFLKAL